MPPHSGGYRPSGVEGVLGHSPHPGMSKVPGSFLLSRAALGLGPQLSLRRSYLTFSASLGPSGLVLCSASRAGFSLGLFVPVGAPGLSVPSTDLGTVSQAAARDSSASVPRFPARGPWPGRLLPPAGAATCVSRRRCFFRARSTVGVYSYVGRIGFRCTMQ